MHKKDSLKKNQLWSFFGLQYSWFDLTSCFCLYSFWILASMDAMEQRMRNLDLFLGLYMCLYILMKHVVDIQTMLLQGKWEKVAILSLMYESMGYIGRSIWSQKRMSGFVECLLLESWTERKFRKQTRVTYITFKFLCERLGPSLKKDDT